MPTSNPCPPASRGDWLLGVALVAATLAAYSRAFGFDFIGFDDPQYVTENARVQAGLSVENAIWALQTTWMGSWHPLTWLSHMLDAQLFALDPAGHHATSVLLHAANTVALFGVLRAATGARWRSALVAALFGLHPLHVESVAWVSERKDVLSTFAGLLAIGAYVGFVRRPSAARYGLVAAAFAASLMSKPMLVTLPVGLLLLDHWPLRRPLAARTLLDKLPLLAMSLVVCALTLYGQARSLTQEQQLPFAARLANAALSATAYLGQLLFPARLAMYYPHPYLPENGLPTPSLGLVLASAALLAAVSAGVLIARRRYLVTGWYWYLLTLLPVIGLVQAGLQSRADRYTYAPSIGIFLAIVWAAAEAVTALDRRVPGTRRATGGAAVLALAVLGIATWHQTAYWRNSLALYEHTLAVTGANPVIRFNYANELKRAGRTEEAVREYRRTLESSPEDVKVRVNLANALREQGDLAGAAAEYREVLAQRPRFALAHANLGAVLRAQGDLEGAEAQYRESLRLKPTPTTVYNLANVLQERGELDGAIELYRKLLTWAPEARVHNNLAIALETRGDLREALDHYLEAVALDPEHSRAHNNAGALLLRLGERERAIEHLRRALEIDPRYAKAHTNLGIALEQAGERDAALEQYRRALELEPGDEEARKHLAGASAGE